jgi:hypothetical protein
VRLPPIGLAAESGIIFRDCLLVVEEDLYAAGGDGAEDVRWIVGDVHGGLEPKNGAVELHAGGHIADDKIGRELLKLHEVSLFIRGG